MQNDSFLRLCCRRKATMTSFKWAVSCNLRYVGNFFVSFTSLLNIQYVLRLWGVWLVAPYATIFEIGATLGCRRKWRCISARGMRENVASGFDLGSKSGQFSSAVAVVWVDEWIVKIFALHRFYLARVRTGTCHCIQDIVLASVPSARLLNLSLTPKTPLYSCEMRKDRFLSIGLDASQNVVGPASTVN